MNVAEYIAEYIASLGVTHVFAVAGGASLRMIHALAVRPEIKMIYPHHEQAAAMAADGYARVSGKIGVCISTSGPGATNMLTGIACAYYDSIPMLCLTGNVATFRRKGDSGVRQIGFQETDILAMTGPITKYARQVDHAPLISEIIKEAVSIAMEHRRGPVLVDVCDDVQRVEL